MKARNLRGFFSIKAKLLIALSAMALIPLSIGGIYGIYYSIKALEDTTLHHLQHELSSKAEDIGKFLETVHKDVLLLSQALATKELINFNGPKDSKEFYNLRNRAEDVFFAFSRTRLYYYQVRYINEEGKEVVRVDSDGNTSIPIPLSKLQYKGDRYYFIDSMNYPKGECYVSPMDLNIEWGEIEVPYKPVVRIATPVFNNQGQRKGIVLINIYASYIIEQMQKLNIAKGGSTSLLSREGLYLSHLNAEQGDESFTYGSTKNLEEDYPKDVVSSILSGKPGMVRRYDSIISYAPIFTGDKISNDYWVLTIIYPKRSIFAPVYKMEIFYIFIGIISLSVAVLVGVWIARRFTRPILELHQGVERIAEGNFNHKLNIDTGDEIEGLSHRFNAMTDKLREFREQVINWNEELQREVERQTKELGIEKNKLENILMCASEGIVVADEEDKIIIMNPAAEALLRIKKEEMLGKTIFSCHRNPERVKGVLRGNKAPAPRHMTIGSRVMEISVASIVSRGERFGSMMVMRDITERQRLVEERMTMERQLFHADKLVSLGELSAGIAHEIGNPLAAIKTVIQAADDETPFIGKQKKYMERILKEVDRLSLFLKTFSAFANPGVKHSARSRVDQVIKDVLFLIRNEALKHNIKITDRIGKNIPEVRMDLDHLKQIFMNLVLNAIQAIGRDGRITISASRLNEVDVEISVSDNGPGISEENISKIFNPFFTTKPDGTGLGLSIVHRIITEHGGSIKVRSEVGVGTTFELTLPVERRRKDRERTLVLQS